MSFPARYATYWKPGMKLRERINRQYRGPPEEQRHAGGSEDPHVYSGQ